jgi:hypothetical protein
LVLHIEKRGEKMKNITNVWNNLDTQGKVNFCLMMAMSVIQGFVYAPYIGILAALVVVVVELAVLYICAAQLQRLIKIEKGDEAVPAIFATLILIADIIILWNLSWVLAVMVSYYLSIVYLKNDEVRIAMNVWINKALEEKNERK